MRRIEPERIERAARIYASNQEASQALGIAPGSFSRLCRAYGIETPHARWCRRRQEGRRTRLVHAMHLAAGGQLAADAAAEAAGEAARLGLDLEDVLATAGALDEAY